VTDRQLRFHSAAREELRREALYYEMRVQDLGSELTDEVEGILQNVLTYPELGSPHLLGTRRVVLDRFPFSLIYRIGRADILVIALAHERKRPGYWRSRK
jgi:toxin ParE1/3/4